MKTRRDFIKTSTAVGATFGVVGAIGTGCRTIRTCDPYADRACESADGVVRPEVPDF